MKYLKIVLLLFLLLFVVTEAQRQRRQQRHHNHQQHHHRQQQQRQQQQRQQQKSQGQDYYKLLGVKRGCDDKELRRAFKKLSLKYHPDKNKDDPETANKKFQEIANAYEVLKDPEQRQVYDQYGEQGIKEGKGRQQNQHQGQDMWSHFFQQGGQQQQQDLFHQSDVFVLDMEKIGPFFRRREVWLIYFYKMGDRRSHKHIDLVKELAQKFYGIFKIAAVDCDSQDVLCEEEFQAFTYPQFMVYESNSNEAGVTFTKDVSYNSVAGFAISKMENFVRYLNPNNYEDFLKQETQNDKVVLLTKSKTTPPLLKALSKDLRGKLSFGMVRADQKDLLQKFNVQESQLPILMVLDEGEQYKGKIYDGKFNKDRIMIFLRPFAYKDKKKATKELKIYQFTQQLSKQSGTCAKNDKNYCFMVIYEKNQQQLVEDNLMHLAAKYLDDPINFYYVQKENIEYPNIFEDGDVSSFPATFIVRGKRNKYTKFQQNEFVKDKLESFVDDVLGGGGTYTQLYDEFKGNIFNDGGEENNQQKTDL